MTKRLVSGPGLFGPGYAPKNQRRALIPHTLEVTTLSDRQPHDRVNLEADVLGKYVKRYLERMLPSNDEAAR